MKLPDCLSAATACLTALCLLTPSAALSADSGSLERWALGEVRAREGGSLLYREHHLAPPSGGLPSRVEYRRENGELFAEKTLDHSRSRTAPAIDFRDHRRDVRIVTRYPEGSDTGQLQMAYYPPGDEEPRRKMFETDSLIVDAGFDPFVQQHWKRLLDGERIVADFLVPSRQDTIKVGITKVDKEQCRTAVEGIHCMKVSPAGALRLFSWFVEPIYLAYHPQPLRLVLYQGRGNIPDASGDSRQVRIQYDYDGAFNDLAELARDQ